MDSWRVQLEDFRLRGKKNVFYIYVILVDLQQMFDTLVLTALLEKKECIIFKESVWKRFQLYLSVDFLGALDDVFSDSGLTNSGVLQGFILGLVLVLIDT